jgi:hypothetical protein
MAWSVGRSILDCGENPLALESCAQLHCTPLDPWKSSTEMRGPRILALAKSKKVAGKIRGCIVHEALIWAERGDLVLAVGST